MKKKSKSQLAQQVAADAGYDHFDFKVNEGVAGFSTYMNTWREEIEVSNRIHELMVQFITMAAENLNNDAIKEIYDIAKQRKNWKDDRQ